MRKQKLKTFSSIKSSARGTKTQKKEVILKAERNLFGHMIIASQCRNLHMKDVLAHPLVRLPWALSNPDGSLWKIRLLLQENWRNQHQPLKILENTMHALLIEWALSRVKGDGKTFGENSNAVLNQALHEGRNSMRIDVIFDVDRKTSIKNAERCSRGSASSTQWKNIATGHKVMQWRKLLSIADSKTALIKFIVDQWKLTENRVKLQNKQLIATCGETCYCLSQET